MQRRKLIEVALPLDAINRAATREKLVRHGHPSALHLWWTRRPQAAARAVIFAQMVDDPSGYADELLADPHTRLAASRELQRLGKPVATEADLPDFERGSAAVSPNQVREPDDLIPPQAACRALRGMAVALERERLFKLLDELVQWENTSNEDVLKRARTEIRRSWRRACTENENCEERLGNKGNPSVGKLFDPDKLPEFHDPFAGGGALPLEAQRLGLNAYASDLNPVAVLISKAMIEIPPRFAHQPPVNPDATEDQAIDDRKSSDAQGLAEDARYYANWVRDEAERRIGHLYPKVEITPEIVRERPDLEPYERQNLTVVAWLWARTVKSPHPAFADVDVPLVSSFMLSTRRGREAYVEPVIEVRGYRFAVKTGQPANAGAARSGTRLSARAFRCLLSDVPIPYEYIDEEANAGRMKERLLAVVAAGDRSRIYLSPMPETEAAARSAKPVWKPDTLSRGTWASNAQGRRYGFETFADYFTPRQLVALTTLSDLVTEAIAHVRGDAIGAGLSNDGRPLRNGGAGATAYADAVGVYLAFALSRLADRGSTICTWSAERESIRNTFVRQAIPMTWDYAELNPLPSGTGSFAGAVRWIAESIAGATASTARIDTPRGCVQGTVARDDDAAFGNGASFGSGVQADATLQTLSMNRVVSTDPPYYNNVGYADLSDFFYVWLRRCLEPVFPDLFAELAVPKTEELVPAPDRHGDKDKAVAFFLKGMRRAMRRMAELSHPGFPVTIYCAFKPSGSKGEAGAASANWEALVDSVLRSGLVINGTWPVRTESSSRIADIAGNQSASGIVLVCRRRPDSAPAVTHREFLTELRAELPQALRLLQASNLAPADLSHAATGPGLAVYARYAWVLGADGQPLPVREVLARISQTLNEALAAQEDALDTVSRWAMAWFDQHGFGAGDRGGAETLAKAKHTSLAGIAEAGIIRSRAGYVRLLRPEELPSWWDPAIDERPNTWKTLHHLVRLLALGGVVAAAVPTAHLSGADRIRDLCYRLYALCVREKRDREALSYNALVQGWPEIGRLARKAHA